MFTNCYSNDLSPLLDKEGTIIIIDRWTLSSYVYQGFAVDPAEYLRVIDDLVEIESLFQPTSYIVLDAPDTLLNQRLYLREDTDKFELDNMVSLVREGYRYFVKDPRYNLIRVDENTDQNFKQLLSFIIKQL